MNLSFQRGIAFATGLTIAFVFAGCSNSPRCVPVSGTVTLDEAKVPGPGFIYFTTAAAGQEGVSSRPGTAAFDADGRYTATTFVPGDGLLPGTYNLRVDCWQTAPNMEGKPVVSFISAKYQNAATSELQLVVAEDARKITFDLKLKSK